MPTGFKKDGSYSGKVFQKGDKTNLGRKHTEEHRRKNSEVKKGLHSSPDTEFTKGITAWNKDKECPQISQTLKGRKLSDEHKTNISLNSSHHPAWNKGLKGFRAGEKNNWWKGGISKGYKEGYWSTDYKQWRLAVFERDGYTCQVCKGVGGYLTAHHIKSWAHYPELRFDIDNGITLCEECHALTDNYKGRCKHHPRQGRQYLQEEVNN